MIADEELMAYVDGELDADARARVEREMADDPVLRARIESQLDLKRRLAAHFDPVLNEPVPAALSASRSGRRGWQWQEWMAIAATLVIGVMLGPFVLRSSQPLPLMSAAGRVVAIGALETALMQKASGTGTDDGMTIGMSFRDDDGSYCRTFAMNPGPAGLACREWGEWVVEVLARNPKARQGTGGETYRQAGTAFPAAVRNAVEARIKGEPMTAEQEAEANARNWRRPD
ncbi:MAG: hypothetical protein ABW136_09560 [Steroidobacteraceae bacterium]